jgi:hypothetical protein
MFTSNDLCRFNDDFADFGNAQREPVVRYAPATQADWLSISGELASAALVLRTRRACSRATLPAI